jgi:hypothetical protein
MKRFNLHSFRRFLRSFLTHDTSLLYWFPGSGQGRWGALRVESVFHVDVDVVSQKLEPLVHHPLVRSLKLASEALLESLVLSFAVAHLLTKGARMEGVYLIQF